jgi:transcriptional regulator with XRE-family HTH domain
VGNIESGRTEPSAAVLRRIYEVTGCDLHWLLTGEERLAAVPRDPAELGAVQAAVAHLWASGSEREWSGLREALAPVDAGQTDARSEPQRSGSLDVIQGRRIKAVRRRPKDGSKIKEGG